MNKFEESLLKYLTEPELGAIRSKKIGIAGVGGLGSNCAMHLVRSGFNNFVICDYDVVEASNLNRQYFFADQIGFPKVDSLASNMRKVNESLKIEAICVRLDSDSMKKTYADCDAIVEAFDCPESKRMIVESFANSGKFLVSASGIAGIGNSDSIATKKLGKNFFVIGDLISGVSSETHPFSPRVGIAAAKQADLILAWALGKV